MQQARRSLHVSGPAPEERAVLARLSLLDRFLPLWILLAMAGGLLLGRFFPAIQGVLDAVRIGNTSLPIAMGLLLMMYPVLAKVHDEELGHAARDRRLLRLSLLLVWGLGPDVPSPPPATPSSCPLP